MLGKLRAVPAHDARVHAELSLGEFGAGGGFGCELVRAPGRRRIDWHVRGAEKECGVPRNFAPGGKLALVAQFACDRCQRDRVDVEHRLGLRLVAGPGIVTGETQYVAHAASGRAHEIGLERKPVAIAAGELEDGLDAGARQ